MKLDIPVFGGMRPRLTPELLDPQDAADCSGAVLGSGALDPEVVSIEVGTVTKAGSVKSIYYMPAEAIWLHWTTVVDVVRDPKAGNTDDRVIYTGDGAPKFTDNTLATSGVGTDYPLSWYLLGLPAPPVATSLSVAGGSAPTETRSYVYTYVDAYDSEGPPSPPLTTTGNIDGTWNFNGMDVVGSANRAINKKRIYRTVTGSDGTTTYLFVAEVNLANANYADTIATANLGEELPSATWVAPPTDLHSIVSMPGGILAGLSGNEICFSEPYQAHAWPTAYRVTIDYPGVGLGAFNSNLVAASSGTPYLLSGSHPDSMSITRIDAMEPCISKRSVVSMGFGVAYASPNGLVLVSTAGTDVVTKDLFSIEQWKAVMGFSAPLNPSNATIIGARYRNKYAFVSSDGLGGIVNRIGIIDRSEKPYFYRGAIAATSPSVFVSGFFVNQEQEDQLYILGDDKKIYAYGWDPTSLNDEMQPQAVSRTYGEAIWLSKRFRFTKPVSLGYLRVLADLSNAHSSYLRRHEDEAEIAALDAIVLDSSAIAAHAIADEALAGGEGDIPTLYEPASGDQGVISVSIYADNSQGRHAGGMDAMQLVDTFYVTGPHLHRIKNAGRFDVWQIAVTATARVKRITLAESAKEFQEG